MKALSLRQPWCDAVLYGGKRIENRPKWTNSHFRGRFLIHAAKGMTRAEYAEACLFMAERGIEWRPGPRDKLVHGAIVGAATVVDVIMPNGERYGRHTGQREYWESRHPLAGNHWYMGGFALVLEDVVAFPKAFPYKGALGFFDVDAAEIISLASGHASA